MKKLIKDYHGFTVDDALRDVEDILYTADPEEFNLIKLITGRGKIHDAVVDYLDYSEVEWMHEGNNDGVVIVQLPEDL